MAHAHVTATVTELPDSRVRVEATVDPDEVERSLQSAARALGREMRIPGFRKGKVPPPVVISRLGRASVLDEAIRGELGHWYADAIASAGVATVGDPELNLEELPSEGEPLTFSIEIGVRPPAKLGGYKGLEVGRRAPEVLDDQIEEEITTLRERAARLETVERPAEKGDFVVMDFVGTLEGVAFRGGEARDQLVELGGGRLVPGFEEQLEGAAAGEDRAVKVTFPEDYGNEELAGREAEFAVTVKEVKSKRLPELDDEFALEAAGFDTLEELREDLRQKMQEGEESRIAAEFREAALDAAVAEASVDLPDTLVQARARELWEQMVHSLSHQGISRDVYLRIAGKPEEELIAEAEPSARRDLLREAVIEAIIEAEGIEPTDEEIEEELSAAAERDGTSTKKLIERLKSAGRLEQARHDLAARRAVELIAEQAKPISVEQAKAKKKLWTPEKGEEGEGAGGRLWTPGS